MTARTKKIAKLMQQFYPTEKDKRPFALEDFQHLFGKVSEALLYSSLYLPDLVEIEGSVLLSSYFDTEEAQLEFKKAKELGDWTTENLEASYNQIEVGYLFVPAGRNMSEQEDELLAHIIRDSWDAWLHYQYPDRKFNVQVVSTEEMGSTVGVQFYEIRNLGI